MFSPNALKIQETMSVKACSSGQYLFPSLGNSSLEVIFAGSQEGHPNLVFSSYFLRCPDNLSFLLLLLTTKNFISTSLESKSYFLPRMTAFLDLGLVLGHVEQFLCIWVICSPPLLEPRAGVITVEP